MVIYIDADKLKQNLADLYDFAKWDPREIHFSLFDMVGNIDGEPTADVAPVVHAHWVDHKNNYVPIDASGDVSRSAFCSNCREWLTASDEYACRGNYCPNCGAKMDEEVQ